MSKHQGPKYRAGFVSFVGRPNAGKSTLTNALVGEKIAITSNKPQTTRKAIRGIRTTDNGQLVIVDTPGIHRPRTLLGQRLNDLVADTLGEVDVIGLCVPADQKVGPGDKFINEQLDDYPHAKKVAIVTKIDLAKKSQIAHQLLAVDQMRDWDLVIPVGAIDGDNLDVLVSQLIELLPTSPQLYPEDVHTEEDTTARVSELIREAALSGVEEELPHSIAVVVTDVDEDDPSITRIYADLVVERDSQKGIVIGRKGGHLKQIGIDARAQIEQLLGRKVYLDLHVRVAKEWQRDPKQLGRLGF